MNHNEKIANELKLKVGQVTAVTDLLDSGNTIPFIARYRKEMTGSLDEEQLRQIGTMLDKLRALDDRRQTIVAAIEEQGKMTPELHKQLLAAETLTALEDLYQPYKKKRATRASAARDKGLQPLADIILAQPLTNKTAAILAKPFVTEEVPTIEEALAGARDIVAETISDHANVRQRVREKALQWSNLISEKIAKAEDERQVYQLYYEFNQRIDRIRPHQTLAINRGETEKILRVKVDIAERDWLIPLRTVFRPNLRSPLAEQMQIAIEDAAQRLLLPTIERDVRRHLTEQAEAHAIQVFAHNLRGLLSQPPLAGHTVLALDPGYRTGCKVAVMDPTGKVLDTGAIYPHQPQKQWDESLKTLATLVNRHHVSLIAIGNGTASRETEQLAAELTRKLDSVSYLIVNEAGASVYSASLLARAEMPDLDVTLRGAVSIGRRVQDPLAELVKIDPKAIGIGLYQHDVNQKELAQSLDGVVESVVNQVGVDVNTASPALLAHVAGIGPKLAERIVKYRDENGRFPHRRALLDVNGLGSKAFEQSAGFLRIRDGEEPLDASAIHPESYGVATAVLQRAGLTPETPLEKRETVLARLQPSPQLAAELGTGVPTLADIFEQLVRPGRDPREDLPAPILRSDVLSIADLLPGMQLNGTVRNVVDFGAFIDIGVKQDGLLHRSQIPRGHQFNVGDILKVEILKVDADRNRISLGWPGKK
ncbi:MAG: RNA-binding transcriptional accessory protein [Ardenticatenaceae bacterium]|nr:RNA-binding transcriptional accessory protein [Ardenticatenaceae bacterium]